jgi:hypothetical protein
MKLKLFTFSILIFLSSFVFGQNFGPDTKISLITIGPGKDLYSKFGHSAIRLSDPSNRIDLSYNYGTFDFDTPNFYPKFVRGKLDYILSVDKTEPLLRYYQRTGREVVEQELNFTQEEVSEVAAFLINNYKPENRTYKYDFFYDNCATRLRDIIEEKAEGRINYKATPKSGQVYRDKLIEKLKTSPLILLGINLILGPNTDRPIDLRGEMFLPSYLMDNIEYFAFDANEVPLVEARKLLFPERIQFAKPSLFQQPALYVFILFLVSLYSYISGRFTRFQDMLGTVLFSIGGICGVLFLFMWLGTDHQTTHMNLNLLWANPVCFYFLSKLKTREISSRALKFQKGALLIGLTLLVFIPLLHLLTGRFMIDFLLVPRYIPFQIFIFSILGMLWMQILMFRSQKS